MNTKNAPIQPPPNHSFGYTARARAFSDEELHQLARTLAPLIANELKVLIRPGGGYVKGVSAIARFLCVSDQTVRNRKFVPAEKHTPGSLRIPICGTEEFHHKGKIAARPIARLSDLKEYKENLSAILSCTSHHHQRRRKGQ